MSNYRVGIDCRLAGRQHAGIGRYVVELVKRVTAHTEIDWVIFYSDSRQIDEIFGKQVPTHCELIYSPIRHYTLKEQTAMNGVFTRASLDLLHVPHFNIPVLYSRPLVITIHDLLWHEHKGASVTTLPAWKYWIKYSFYRYVTKMAVKKAEAIFVPTKTVGTTLERYFPTSAPKIMVTREGISEALLSKAKLVTTSKHSTKQLLYVGSLYPHKNVSLVLRALKQLPNYTLVIVSSRDVFRNKLERLVKKLQLNNQVTFHSNISDNELAQMYKNSAALVQPSLSEGFGLTGLEALAFSTPLIASDIPVFHEVYEKAAIYFNPHSEKDFLKAISTLESKEVIQSITASASKVIKKNNWDTLATITYNCYLDTLQGK